MKTKLKEKISPWKKKSFLIKNTKKLRFPVGKNFQKFFLLVTKKHPKNVNIGPVGKENKNARIF